MIVGGLWRPPDNIFTADAQHTSGSGLHPIIDIENNAPGSEMILQSVRVACSGARTLYMYNQNVGATITHSNGQAFLGKSVKTSNIRCNRGHMTASQITTANSSSSQVNFGQSKVIPAGYTYGEILAGCVIMGYQDKVVVASSGTGDTIWAQFAGIFSPG